ncbi:MAG: glycosyltransferase [Bacteroidia bacterium]|nr:glycosyltransferase [Bacteroidia bacterium]NNL81665.1 glycosyltransferase family 2 protein [Flavobacteriaceae bacterium]
MRDSLVSILTPFKNSAIYLEECLDSIIAQSYQNWELIMVNDHSSDHGAQIARAYSEADPRIQVFQNDESGIIPALRLAFRKSKGQFLTRMDSDDIMMPDKLKLMTEQLTQNGRGHLALGLVKYFSEYGISDGYQKYEKWLNLLTLAGDNYSEIYKECVIPSPCWMAYRDDFIKCGGFEPDRYPEDYDLTFRFYENNLKCLPSSKLLHQWRDYPERTSRNHIHYAQNYFLEIKTHYFLKLNYDRSRPLTIWGAGFKGKKVASLLLENQVPFHWICDNPKKIGKSIYDQPMLPFEALDQLNNPQSIITVANSKAQEEIRRHLNKLKMKSMIDYFFFC